MIKGKLRGIALAVTLIILIIIITFGLVLGTVGVINLRKVKSFEYSTAALYVAKAGVAQAINQLKNDYKWSPASYSSSLTSTSGTYTITFGAGQYDSTNRINYTTDFTRADGVTVPKGFCYIISTGTVNNISKRIAAMIKCTYSAFNYALASANDITLSANTKIIGNVKSNGNISFEASADVIPYTYNGEGNIYSASNVFIKANVTVDPGKYVRAAGAIDDADKLKNIPPSQIIPGDTTNYTKPFICDGSVTPTTLPGRESLPNPDMTKLLAPGSYTTHLDTTISSNFNLGGGVHYFPNGVVFTSGSILEGEGTIVSGNGNTIEFNTSIGSESNYFPINIVAVDSPGGAAGSSKIMFNKSTFIHGLVYSHGNIVSETNFRVSGAIVSYNKTAGGGIVSAKAHAEFYLDTFAVPIVGFEPWFGNGTGGVGADSFKITAWYLVY